MRVLILDVPNKPHAQAGQTLNLPDAEAKDMIARGTATTAPDEPPAELPEPEPEPESEPDQADHDDAPPTPKTKAARKSRR